MTQLLLATQNTHKRDELARLLAPLGERWKVVLPDELGGIPEVVEDQPSFAGNAAKKALSAASARGTWALADDSGLCVDHLDGAPGVFSARYAGEDASDQDNNALLLEELAGVPSPQRGAHFVCALALASPDATLAFETRGESHGRILEAARGEAGFGYDPLFLFDEPEHPQRGRTFAQLGTEEKSLVSHRGRALRSLVARLALLPTGSA